MSIQLHRREFLRKSLQTALTGAAALGAGLPLAAMAARGATSASRNLNTVFLDGGVDARLLFMPAPNHDQAVSRVGYMHQLWRAREALYPRRYARYSDLFVNEYLPVTDPRSGFQFGIHDSCTWLKSAFDQGRVAIVANTMTDADFASRLMNLQAPESGLTASRYGGWDATGGHYAGMVGHFHDLFGAAGIMAALDRRGTRATHCLVPRSGRALLVPSGGGSRADGAACTLLVGDQVRGGVYGELFPEAEALPTFNGAVPLKTPNQGPAGQVSNSQVLEEALGWAQARLDQRNRFLPVTQSFEQVSTLNLFSG